MDESQKIAIIDYGVGNLASIKKMFDRQKIHSEIIADTAQLTTFDKAILPGVGHFKEGMLNLQSRGWIPSLENFVFSQHKPFLGICLGMQLMTKGSEEGDCAGLGWFEATTKKFRFEEGSRLKVPHVGFNLVNFTDQTLGKELPNPSKYYFTHSYYVECNDQNVIAATTTYGVTFSSALRKDNIFGAQFHPEKSHLFGLQLLSNFAGVSL